MFGKLKAAVSWVGSKLYTVGANSLATIIVLSRLATIAGQIVFGQNRTYKLLQLTNGNITKPITGTAIGAITAINLETRAPAIYNLLNKDKQTQPLPPFGFDKKLNWKGKIAYSSLMPFNLLAGFFTSLNMYYFTTIFLPLTVSVYSFFASRLSSQYVPPSDNEVLKYSEYIGLFFSFTNLMTYIAWNLKKASANSNNAALFVQEFKGIERNMIKPALATLPGIVPVPLFAITSTEASLNKIRQFSIPEVLKTFISHLSGVSATVAYLLQPIPAFIRYLSRKNTVTQQGINDVINAEDLPDTSLDKLRKGVFYASLFTNFLIIIGTNATSIMERAKTDDSTNLHDINNFTDFLFLLALYSGALFCASSTAAVYTALDRESFREETKARKLRRKINSDDKDPEKGFLIPKEKSSRSFYGTFKNGIFSQPDLDDVIPTPQEQSTLESSRVDALFGRPGET